MRDEAAAQTALPRGDPALLNSVAWRSRWASRHKSETYARAALKQIGDNPTAALAAARGYALVTLAWQAKWRGDFDTSLTLGLEAETLLPERDHADARAHTYSILAVLYYSRNRLDLASSAVERGMRIAEPDLHREAYVDLLATKASIERFKGSRSRAGLTLGRARDMAQGADLARIEHNIARWMRDDNAAAKGIKHSEIAIDLCARHANRVVLPYAHEILGACLVAQKDYDRAERAFSAGLDIAIADRDFRAQCQIIQHHAALEHARRNLERARDLNLYGAEIAAQMQYPLWERDFALALAQVYEELGDLQCSLSAHKRAWRFEKTRRT